MQSIPHLWAHTQYKLRIMHKNKIKNDKSKKQGPHQTSSAATTAGSNVNAQSPSPGPYVTTDQYGMYTRLTTGTGSTFISEPYYREYFAADGQGYAPATRTIYGDSDGPQSGTTYEGRFATTATHTKNGTPVYAKTVTAAGLTVDLPSPDSGIGADAITPRDQNNIQQVSLLFKM